MRKFRGLQWRGVCSNKRKEGADVLLDGGSEWSKHPAPEPLSREGQNCTARLLVLPPFFPPFHQLFSKQTHDDSIVDWEILSFE